MITVGLDIGSLSTKSAIVNDNKEILGCDLLLTGGNNRWAAETTFNNVLAGVGLNKNDVNMVVTTGYGRENVPFSHKHVSEIVCHARGIYFLKPHTRTILDIGGQDSKAIQINEQGKVISFMMNDKCAAGSGRFLEKMAQALGVELEDMGTISQSAETSTQISSMCTVFAETEVVSLVAVGTPIPNIIKGIHDSIATRAISLLKTVGINEPLAMSGGVAKNRGVVSAIEEKLGSKIEVSEYSQFVGAIGAALIGHL